MQAIRSKYCIGALQARMQRGALPSAASAGKTRTLAVCPKPAPAGSGGRGRRSPGVRYWWLMSRVVERVAGGSHRADDIGCAAGVQRLAQAADMDVDGPRLDVDVMAPDRVQQLLAREHAPGMQHKITQ